MTRLNRSLLPLVTLALGVLSVPVAAKDKDRDAPSTPPPVFQAVLDCKSVADAAERLACYDRTVGAMAAARETKDLVIADRETMREARKGLFGLSLPSIKLFGGGDSEDVKAIESTIDIPVVFRLEDKRGTP